MIASDMKQLNRKVVFDLVRERRTVTRVELSSLTGMSGPSILAIVNDFLEKGILQATGKQNGAPGRSPVTLSFNPDAALSIGVEAMGGHITAGLVNLDGKLLRLEEAPAPANMGPGFFRVLSDLVEQLAEPLSRQGKTYTGVGLGLPCAVDPSRQVIQFAPYLDVKEPLNISTQLDALENRFGKPVFPENDVNASAVGEHYIRRLERDIPDLLYISAGTDGVGAGLILDGNLRRGRRGLCGEIGYAFSRERDSVTREAAGHLETNLSRRTLSKRFRNYGSPGQADKSMIRYVVELLAPPIANLINMLDLDTVVLGGRLLTDGGLPLTEALAASVRAHTLSPVRVERGMEHACVAGSALLAFDELWNTIL